MPAYPIAAEGVHAPIGVHPSIRADVKRRARAVPKLASILLLVLIAFSVLNVGGVYTYVFGAAVPINPITTAVLAIPIFMLTTGGFTRVAYFRSAWLFWIVYAVGGFFGPLQITTIYLYGTMQAIFKIWISLIGIPWLAARCVNEKTLPGFVRTIYVSIAAGSTLAVVQLFYPAVFVEATTGGGRGAGLWINPNVCSAMCASGVILSLMFPFRFILVNVAVRTVLLVGLGATLSRAGIASALMGLFVYGLMAKGWTATLKFALLALLLGVCAFFALEPLKQSHIPGLAARAESIQQILTGGVGASMMQNRWMLWRGGFEAASEYWLRGRGHGSMNYIVKLVFLEHEGRWHSAGPHNYYLFVWGNSGIAALIALLILWFHMFWIGWTCRISRIRAGLIALVVLVMLLAVSSHSLFAMQFTGPVFAAFALAGHYGGQRASQRMPVFSRPVVAVPAN